MSDKPENANEQSTEVTEETQSPWYYFYSVGCGFCKKVDPIIVIIAKI